MTPTLVGPRTTTTTTNGILAIDKRGEIGTRCSGTSCTPDGADAYTAAQDRATVATVATVVGVAAGVVGGWLFFTSQPAHKGDVKKAGIGIRGRLGGAELGVGGVF